MADAATAHEPVLSHPIRHLDAVAQRHDVGHRGRTVCWRRFGEGPPLVLLHGGHGSWLHWVSNIDALARTHTVLVPDLPGFGESEDLDATVPEAERFERLVQATRETLDALVGRETPVDVAAFSFGSLVAAHLAVHRGRVRRLAFVGPTGHGGPRRQSAELLKWRLAHRQAQLQALEHNLAVFMLHDTAAPDDLALAVHEVSCRRTRFRSASISRRALLKQVLAPLSQWMLFVWGEHDVTGVPEAVALEMTEPHENREWCIVPGAGHWVQYQRAGEINRLLATWFDPRAGVGA